MATDNCNMTWSMEEMIENAGSWSLAGDVALLNNLRAFSERALTQTELVSAKVDNLLNELNHADLKLDLVKNEFHRLRNSQFIECRVYEEDETIDNIEENADNKGKNNEATEEQKEEAMKQAIARGLTVLERYFDKVEVSVSDSEEENDRSFILQQKDLYAHRPLPYLVGSQQWHKKWHVGLINSDSDSETQKDPEIYSSSDSESELPRDNNLASESSSEVDFIPKAAANSTFSEQTDDKTLHSSDESEGQHSFPSEAPITQQNFAEQLAEKLGDVISGVNKNPIKTTSSHDKYMGKFFSDEPPPLEEQDVATGRKQLFSEGENLFDKGEEDDDLFWGPQKVTKGNVQQRSAEKKGLFDDSQSSSSDEDIFSNLQKKKFDNKDSYLKPFRDVPPMLDEKPPEITPGSKKKPVGGVAVFGANADIFQPQLKKNTVETKIEEKSKAEDQPKPGLFDDTVEDTDLFNETPSSSKIDEETAPSKPSQRKIKTLFGDEDEYMSKSKKKISLFDEDDDFFDNEDDIFADIGAKKTLFGDSNVKTKKGDRIITQRSLFDSDDEDESQREESEVLLAAKDKSEDAVKSTFGTQRSLFGSSDEMEEKPQKEESKTIKDLLASKEDKSEKDKSTFGKQRSLFDSSDEMEEECQKEEDFLASKEDKGEDIKSAFGKHRSLFDSSDEMEEGGKDLLASTEVKSEEVAPTFGKQKSLFDSSNEMEEESQKEESKSASGKQRSLFDSSDEMEEESQKEEGSKDLRASKEDEIEEVKPTFGRRNLFDTSDEMEEESQKEEREASEDVLEIKIEGKQDSSNKMEEKEEPNHREESNFGKQRSLFDSSDDEEEEENIFGSNTRKSTPREEESQSELLEAPKEELVKKAEDTSESKGLFGRNICDSDVVFDAPKDKPELKGSFDSNDGNILKKVLKEEEYASNEEMERNKLKEGPSAQLQSLTEKPPINLFDPTPPPIDDIFDNSDDSDLDSYSVHEDLFQSPVPQKRSSLFDNRPPSLNPEVESAEENSRSTPEDEDSLKTRTKPRPNLEINVNALLPSAQPPKFRDVARPIVDVSQPEVLLSVTKDRVKIPVKRRPSTRKARHEAIRNSMTDFRLYSEEGAEDKEEEVQSRGISLVFSESDNKNLEETPSAPAGLKRSSLFGEELDEDSDEDLFGRGTSLSRRRGEKFRKPLFDDSEDDSGDDLFGGKKH